MHDDVRNTLSRAILKVLTELQGQTVEDTVNHLIWRRKGNGVWNGSYEPRPKLSRAFLKAINWKELSSEFEEAMLAHHPEHLNMVGTVVTGTFRLEAHKYLRSAIGRVWIKYSTLTVPEDVIESIVQEVADFIDCRTILFSYLAPLINFRAEDGVDRIECADGLIIQRLTDEEVTQVHGGRIDTHFGPFRKSRWINDFAFVGFLEASKILDGGSGGTLQEFEQLKRSLDRAVLALRTFKAGPVGYDTILLRSPSFTPIGGVFGSGSGHVYIPLGSYSISSSEVEHLMKHNCDVFRSLHPTLESACRRLADAQVRLNAGDRIIDIVIGLEAILLACVKNETYRGELRYRFALNYSTFYDTPDKRLHAFHVGKDLYDHRSALAHGGKLNENTLKLGGEKVDTSTLADKSCEILRAVIHTYLPSGTTPPYLEQDYWEKRIFRLNDASRLANAGDESS